MKKIRTGDTVHIMLGKDKGKTGKVIQVFPSAGKIVVEGVHIIKKHMRARREGERGQVLELSAPFAASKAQLACPHCAKPTRIHFKIEGGVKSRTCAKCKEAV